MAGKAHSIKIAPYSGKKKCNLCQRPAFIRREMERQTIGERKTTYLEVGHLCQHHTASLAMKLLRVLIKNANGKEA